MAQTATLINLSPRPRTIVLDHPAFRDKQYGFKRVAVPAPSTSPSGRSGNAFVRQSIPGSITVPGMGKVEGLHPAIKHCAQVRTQLGSTLRIELVNVPDVPLDVKPTGGRRRGGKSEAASSEGDS